MNDHQRHLWQRMIDLIEQYREKQIGFFDLVGELEGTLDAGDFQDETLREGWYQCWLPLEIRRAIDGDAVTDADVAEEIEALRLFLVAQSQTSANN